MIESSAIPFIVIGNRRALTLEQMCEDRSVMDFFIRFRHCFEPALDYRLIWFFIEP